VTDWFDDVRGSSDPIDPAVVVTGDTLGAILDVVRESAMVSVSTTRDGGAVRISVMMDGRPKAEYFRDPGNAQEWLGHAAIACRNARENGGRGGTAPPR